MLDSDTVNNEIQAFSDHNEKAPSNSEEQPTILEFESEEIAKKVFNKIASTVVKSEDIDAKYVGGSSNPTVDKVIGEYLATYNRMPTVGDLKKFRPDIMNGELTMGDAGFSHTEKRPVYSKGQIGQALANQQRALRAGRRLAKKQKAQHNKCKQA